jgi:cell shape-determining protein MreD
VGLLVGMVEDSLSGRLYGFYGCADTAVGYLAAVVAQRVVIQRVTGVMLAFLAASIAQQAILLLLALVIVPAAGGPSIPWIVVRAGATALLGGLWHLASASWHRRYEGWRRSRGSRLQFGR